MLLGLGLALLGIVAFVVQMNLHRLSVPWYMPIMALIGAVLIGVSLRERRTTWRVITLGFVVLLGGFELFALNALRLPPYTGPIAVGKPFPVFKASLADGTAFTQENLTGDHDTALVFFRGRW